MTDFTDSCVPPDVDEITTRLVISAGISTDLASQSVSSSSVPEAEDDELKQVDRIHGHVLEKPCTCENKSSGNANIMQEVRRFQICNKEAILQGGKSGPDTNNDHDRCGMPEDLLFDILKRLPVISLIRLRSVCKSWCALIDSSTFIAHHFDHNRGKDSLIAVDYCRDDDSSKLCLLSGSKYEVYKNLDCELEWTSYEEVTIGNCCNGIVCLVNRRRGIADLWNPALKQKKRVPESSVSPESLILSGEYDLTYGFGYDDKSDDYKVVKIHFNVEYGSGAPDLRFRHNGLVEVYSVRDDSWKIIQDALPVEAMEKYFMPWQTLSVKGKCYWIGCVDRRDYQVLVSFDLKEERFETMALPGEENSTRHGLELLGGKLVCIKGLANDDSYGPLDPEYYQIWVLEDEDGSWTKLREFGPIFYLCYETRIPVAFSRNGEFLLITDSPLLGSLYLCNFAAGEEDYVGTHDLNLSFLSFDHYTESLVPLKRLNCGSAY